MPGALWIADRSEALPALGQAASYQNAAWMMAYLVMAVSMVVGMVTVLFSNEPARVQLPPAKNLAVWLQGAVVEPFADFLRRYGWHAGADPGADCRVPHQRCGDGHHGQPVLCGHGLHQGPRWPPSPRSTAWS